MKDNPIPTFRPAGDTPSYRAIRQGGNANVYEDFAIRKPDGDSFIHAERGGNRSDEHYVGDAFRICVARDDLPRTFNAIRELLFSPDSPIAHWKVVDDDAHAPGEDAQLMLYAATDTTESAYGAETLNRIRYFIAELETILDRQQIAAVDRPECDAQADHWLYTRYQKESEEIGAQHLSIHEEPFFRLVAERPEGPIAVDRTRYPSDAWELRWNVLRDLAEEGKHAHLLNYLAHPDQDEMWLSVHKQARAGMLETEPARHLLGPGLPKMTAPAKEVLELPQHYLISPHADVDTMFFGALGMGEHRISQGKRPIQPVFKDDAQREAFHQRTSEELERAVLELPASSPEGPMPRRFWKVAAMAFLERHSRANAPQTLMDLRTTASASPRVYVIGHGAPATMIIGSATREMSTFSEVADLLSQLELPNESDVRINSCWSAAGRTHLGTDPSWLRLFQDGKLGMVSNTSQSFAAAVHRQLKIRYGFKGTTAGYLAKTYAYPRNCVDRNGALGRHRAGNVGLSTPLKEPRLRDVRVTFDSIVMPIVLRYTEAWHARHTPEDALVGGRSACTRPNQA